MEDSINVLKFAESRAREIMTLKEEVTLKEPKLTLQKLPFHMRRRAASHNPKRLPKSVRVKLPDEIQTKHKKKLKTHKNLLEEYNSRQEKDKWMSTHIWFAKRFHMKKMWGYHLPFQATGKRFRSSYRAIVKNSLVQDLSYFCCIELRGKEEEILSKLSCLTDESVGMNFASESSIDGTKEGHCFLYHPNSFPFCAIGPISFLWKPSIDSVENNSTQERQLWIWCHPSIRDELVKVFIEIFHLKEDLEKPSKQYTFTSQVNYMKCKLSFQKEPVYCGADVSMFVLKDTLIRHRILGPNATSVLTNILKPIESTEEQSSNLLDREQIWKYLSDHQSAYFLPIKTVIGLRVEDPRLYVTHKRKDEFPKGNIFEENILAEFSKPETAWSEIWNMDIRNEVTASQVPEHVLNHERGKYVIPDASDIKKCTTSVPIIIIHQPGVNGYAPGWDIIAPQGWGMAFWIPLIYHGAQPAGFDDFCCINLESGCPTFPLSFPDTEAGFVYEEKTREEKLKKFYRYPRAKRPNFEILGVPSPFFMPWKVLASEWENEFLKKYNSSSSAVINLNGSDKYFTLRCRKAIMCLQNVCSLLQKSGNQEKVITMYNTIVQSTLTNQNPNLKALLLVRVKCLFRGVPTNYSGIYLPSELDLQTLKENPKYFGPLETKHCLDVDLPARKRRKVEAKEKSKKLHRPEIKTVISSAERRIIGYVSEGNYSRLGCQGFALGHCSLPGFLNLLEICMQFQCGVIVLVREQHSFQYRPASVEILDNIF